MNIKNSLLEKFTAFGKVAEMAGRTWALHENGTF